MTIHQQQADRKTVEALTIAYERAITLLREKTGIGTPATGESFISEPPGRAN